ncbi:transmembrane protein 230-like [Phocoena sinus]|uniref:transmembrane protein 230-like n=1 Tax=Phocoena sinus TaxID=42100 RepID=UPI0013C439B1|nr:transmembrane protein 230-like [Phocoena sinus]
MMQSRTNLATRIPCSKVKYSRLSSTEDGYIDLQGETTFKKGPPKIALATVLPMVLFLIGAFLIIIGSLLLAGYISKGIFSYEGVDRAIPVLIIGILVSLLGFYHLHIACYAPKGYWGHSYDDMPDFDD